MFLTIAGIVGGLGALVGGVSSVVNRSVQAQETKRQLELKKTELATAKSNLKESYDLSMRQAREQTEQSNAMLQLQVGQTETMRDLNLKTAGQTAELSDRLAASQIATLQVESSQQQGQAIEAVAQSGFRDTGSALNIVRDTNSKAQGALRQAFLQRNLSRFSDYSSAVSAYLGANNQIEIYQRQVANNNADLRRAEESLTMQYKQQKAQIEWDEEQNQYDMNFMNSSTYKWMQGLGYASDIFGGLSSGLNLFNNTYSMGKAFGWT